MSRNSSIQPSEAARSQAGMAFVGIILSVVVVALLGAAAVSLLSETSLRQATTTYAQQAQELADAGIRYAEGQIAATPSVADPANPNTLNNHTFTAANNAGQFTLNTNKLNLLVNGPHAAGATTVNLKTASGILPKDLSLQNTGIYFWNPAQTAIKTQGRVSKTSSLGATIILESPGLTAALADGDVVISNVVPYVVWSTATYSTGPTAVTRAVSKGVNTTVESWPGTPIATDVPSTPYTVLGVGNPTYPGVVYKDTKLTESNLITMPGYSPAIPEMVARHAGSGGWKAAIELSENTPLVDYKGQNWYTGTYVPFTATYNTTDGVTADGHYVMHWVVGEQVDLSYTLGGPSTGIDRVLSNFVLAAQNYKDNPNASTGYVNVRNIYVNNVLQTNADGNPVTLTSVGTPNGYQALVSQNRQATPFLKITGEVQLVKQGSGNPPGNFGLFLYTYIHDVPH